MKHFIRVVENYQARKNTPNDFDKIDDRCFAKYYLSLAIGSESHVVTKSFSIEKQGMSETVVQQSNEGVAR